MKTMKLLVMAFVLLVFTPIMQAQDYDYLQEARQRITKGDCDGAQRCYNVYKELHKKTDKTIERMIAECGDEKASVTGDANSQSTQADYGFYIQKTQQCLAEGDCEGARRSYNLYKDLSGNRNYSLEEDIQECEKPVHDLKKVTYHVNPDPLVADKNGNICFDVIVHIPTNYFEKLAILNLKLYIAYDGGQKDLEPITVVGEKVKGEGDFRVNYKEGGEFTKRYCMPYQEGMKNYELMGAPMFYVYDVYDGKIYPN